MPAVRRFAIVSPNYHPRTCGVGDHSARLGGELRRRGHEVSIFSRAPARPHPDAPDIAVFGAEGRFPTVIARRVAAAMERDRPTDVILQFTSQMWDGWRFGSPALVWLARRARRAGARVTLIAHELHVPWLPRPDLMLAAALQRAQFTALLASCDHVFVTTETRARLIAPLCRLLGVAPPRVIRVGANALPVTGPGPAAGPAPGGGPRLGVFSTAAVGKRFDVVLEAFAEVAREIPSAELVLIGDLGDPAQPRVRDIARAVAGHAAAARIRMTGKLALSEVAATVATLDAYFFPMSTGANTRSGTLPVALGAGVPVIAVSGADTDLALFRDGDNVVLARSLDGPAFAEAALRLLRDPALAARVAEGGRQLYAEHLRWDRIAERFLAEIA